MPLYTHDCEACTFLGSVSGVDLYIHVENVEGGTIIRRFSSEPADYGALEVTQAIKSSVPEYQNAVAMAKARELLKPKIEANAKYQDGMCDLTGVANNLWTLSNAFKRTGNEQVAKELMSYHERIFEGVDKIGRAHV